MNKINNNSTRAEVLKAVKINGLKIINANKKFLKDKVIVLTAINQRYSVIAKPNLINIKKIKEYDNSGKSSFIYDYIDKSLFKYGNICLALLKTYRVDFLNANLIHKSLFNDIKFIRSCINLEHFRYKNFVDGANYINIAIYNKASKKIKRNRDIAMSLVRKDGEYIFHIDKSFLSDNEIVYQSIKNTDIDDDAIANLNKILSSTKLDGNKFIRSYRKLSRYVLNYLEQEGVIFYECFINERGEEIEYSNEHENLHKLIKQYLKQIGYDDLSGPWGISRYALEDGVNIES